jgi:hypothetical protein
MIRQQRLQARMQITQCSNDRVAALVGMQLCSSCRSNHRVAAFLANNAVNGAAAELLF